VYLGKSVVYLGKPAADLLLEPGEAGGRLFAQSINRRTVGVDLDAEIGKVTIARGGQMPGSRGVCGYLLDPGFQRGDAGLEIGRLRHTGSVSRARPTRAGLASGRPRSAAHGAHNPDLAALRTARIAAAIREGASMIADETGGKPDAIGPRIAAAAAAAVAMEIVDTEPGAEREEAVAAAMRFLEAGTAAL
jgi:hypothetical protein